MCKSVCRFSMLSVRKRCKIVIRREPALVKFFDKKMSMQRLSVNLYFLTKVLMKGTERGKIIRRVNRDIISLKGNWSSSSKHSEQEQVWVAVGLDLSSVWSWSIRSTGKQESTRLLLFHLKFIPTWVNVLVNLQIIYTKIETRDH